MIGLGILLFVAGCDETEENGPDADATDAADPVDAIETDNTVNDGIDDSEETLDMLEDTGDEAEGISGIRLLGTEMVYFKVGEVKTEIILSDLDRTVFDGNEAVRISLVIDEGRLDNPVSYFFNFISSDGFNVLIDRLEGELAGLSLYSESQSGFFYQDPAGEDGLKLGWDEFLGLPGYLNVKNMDGGTVEAVPFPGGYVLVICHSEEICMGIDISVMDTVSIVDFHHPELGEQQVVPLENVIEGAAVAYPGLYGYKFTGSDGYENADLNLVPYENMTHAYIKPENRNVIFEEEWENPTECCWRVKETIIVRALTF